jgi:electron transfer flavoprotein-quinone oxidoreductase
MLSDRVQNRYPPMLCDLVEELFTVRNPVPKKGVATLLRRAARRNGVRLRDLARDGWTGLRSFG